MQKIRSSNPPVVTGICDPNKSRVRQNRSLKPGSKLKYLSNSDRLTTKRFGKNLKIKQQILFLQNERLLFFLCFQLSGNVEAENFVFISITNKIFTNTNNKRV